MSIEKDQNIPEVQFNDAVIANIGEIAINNEGISEPVLPNSDEPGIINIMHLSFASGYKNGFRGWRRSLRGRISL